MPSSSGVSSVHRLQDLSDLSERAGSSLHLPYAVVWLSLGYHLRTFPSCRPGTEHLCASVVNPTSPPCRPGTEHLCASVV